ncbi:MAG TPA: PAS domain-containing protein [Thermoplasmata archaeon]|nr:PAS domain-containing protein [Thermoplasmata archaeon]
MNPGRGERTLGALVPLVGAIPFLGGAGAPEDSAHFFALFEMHPDPNLILDRTRRIRRANPAAVRLFAGPGGALTGRMFAELIDVRSRDAIDRAMTAAVGGAATPTAIAADARAADGTVFPVAVYVGGLRKESGEGFEVIVQDFRGRAGPVPAPVPAFNLAGLLVAKRLKELV